MHNIKMEIRDMTDRQVAFSTFIKLLELPNEKKLATLRGFKRGGGFNYWRPLQLLAPEVIGGKLDISGIQDQVALMAKGHQRKYNDQALTNLLKWRSRRRISPRSRPERITRKFGNAGLQVRIEPEVSFSMDGRDYLMHIWATTTPTLSEETLSMGLHFFRHHAQKAGYADCQFLIFDTVRNRLFGEIGILDNTAEMLRVQRDTLSRMWADMNSELSSPDRPTSEIGDHSDNRPPPPM